MPLLPKDAVVIFLEQLAVPEESRGKGFGFKLMKWLIKTGDQEGCKLIRLTSVKGSQPFYQKLGFLSCLNERMEMRLGDWTPRQSFIICDGKKVPYSMYEAGLNNMRYSPNMNPLDAAGLQFPWGMKAGCVTGFTQNGLPMVPESILKTLTRKPPNVGAEKTDAPPPGNEGGPRKPWRPPVNDKTRAQMRQVPGKTHEEAQLEEAERRQQAKT